MSHWYCNVIFVLWQTVLQLYVVILAVNSVPRKMRNYSGRFCSECKHTSFLFYECCTFVHSLKSGCKFHWSRQVWTLKNKINWHQCKLIVSNGLIDYPCVLFLTNWDCCCFVFLYLNCLRYSTVLLHCCARTEVNCAMCMHATQLDVLGTLWVAFFVDFIFYIYFVSESVSTCKCCLDNCNYLNSVSQFPTLAPNVLFHLCTNSSWIFCNFSCAWLTNYWYIAVICRVIIVGISVKK